MGVRWTGQVQPPVAGDYSFTVETKGATVNVWLDDEQIVAATKADNTSKPIKLNAFQRYDLKVEYTAEGTVGPVRLYWQPPGQQRQIIPRSVLFSKPLADKTALMSSNGIREKIIQMQLPTNKVVRGYYPWKISDFASGLPLGSVIQWRMEVRDNNNVSGPGVTFSENRQLRLVSEADKRKELMDRMGENLAQTDELLKSQGELRDKTAQIVTGKAVDRPLDLPPEPKK
jgi:hypothetical protein